MKRSEMYAKAKHEAKKTHGKERKKRKRETELLGENAPAKPEPRTIDNQREADDTMVDADDEEVAAEENIDEFSSYFDGKTPKIMITSNKPPSVGLHAFIADLQEILPNSAYYKRGTHELKRLCKSAPERGFTDLIVVNENKKSPNGLLLI